MFELFIGLAIMLIGFGIGILLSVITIDFILEGQ